MYCKAILLCVLAVTMDIDLISGNPSVPAAYTNCSQVRQFVANDIIAGAHPLDLTGVKGISYSIGYSVIDKVSAVQSTESSNQACQLQMAKVINRYGTIVAATAAGAQASVRATNFNDKSIQSCLGFGLCANIWDAVDKDVYPISTLTYVVVRTVIPNQDCGRMRIVYDYLKWVLTDPGASAIVTSQAFATMPKKVAHLAIDSVLNVIQCQSSDPSGAPRLLMNEPTPSEPLTIKGAGSSLQNNLQLALLQAYSGAGVSKILYDGSIGSGGGQCLLTVGNVNCWYNASSKQTVNCLQFATTGSKPCILAGPFQAPIDFAGSDSIIQTASQTIQQQGQRMVPVFAAAIGMIYNLPFANLVLSREAANDIFIGNIVSWSDPRIQATNPSATLPDMNIIRLVRLDSSGTTQAFDRALASFANVNNQWGTTNYWTHHVLGGSSLPTWPVDNYTSYDSSMQCVVSHCSRSICSPGFYLDPAQDVCRACPVGKYSDKSSQNLQCQSCPKGYYTDAAGSALCSKCTENSYQDETGQLGCKPCPLNTRRFLLQQTEYGANNKTSVVYVDSSATTIDDCKCLPGFWLPSSLLNTTSISRREGSSHEDLSLGYTSAKGGEACVPCPQGATCPGFQDNLQTIPRPMAGYWGEPRFPYLFYECREGTFCFQDYTCGEGHEGRMCTEEVGGYFTVGEKWYLQCPAQPGAAALLTVFLTVLVLFVWLQIMRFAESTIFDSFDIGIKFLHLIGFIAQFPLRWHPNLDYVVLVLMISNLEINFISPHCIWPTFNGATAFYFQLVVPFIIVGVATLNFYITHRYFPSKKVPLSQAEMEPLLNRNCLRDGSVSMPSWETYAINKSLQVFGFMYQVLVYRNFSCFLCRTDPDGKTRFLYTAPDIECGSGVHVSMMVIAVFYALFVLLGFPAYMLRLLLQAKEDNILVQNDFVMRYGSFYQAWKVDYVWWEVVVLARKFFISLILALCDVPMFQGALAILLIYISIMLHLSASPYLEEWNNVLEIICLFCALAYAACGMIFYPSLDQNVDCVGTSDLAVQSECLANSQIKQFASLALILLVVVTFFLTMSSTCWEVYERYLSKRTSRYIQASQKWFGLKDKREKVRPNRLSFAGTTLQALKPLFGRLHSSGSSDHDMDRTLSGGSAMAGSVHGESLTGASSSTFGGDSHRGLEGDTESSFIADGVKSNKVFPAGVESGRGKRPTKSRESSFEENGKVDPLKAIQLRLSDMLDGYYMTSWKDMLIDMEARDHSIRTKYNEENEASVLLDQEVRYLELDAYLPRFSCQLNRSLSVMSNSDLSAILRKILLTFPAMIDYMCTATEEARTGFAMFAKDFITFCEDRPQFVDGSGRDSIISFEYRSLVADWLIKHDTHHVEMCRALLDDMASAAGLRMDKGRHGNHHKESLLEAMKRLRSQRSFGNTAVLRRGNTQKETVFDAIRRMRSVKNVIKSDQMWSDGESASPIAARQRAGRDELKSIVPMPHNMPPVTEGVSESEADEPTELNPYERNTSTTQPQAAADADQRPLLQPQSEPALAVGPPEGEVEPARLAAAEDEVVPFS